MNSLGCLGGPGFFGSGRVRVGPAMVWAGFGPAHCEAWLGEVCWPPVTRKMPFRLIGDPS